MGMSRPCLLVSLFVVSVACGESEADDNTQPPVAGGAAGSSAASDSGGTLASGGRGGSAGRGGNGSSGSDASSGAPGAAGSHASGGEGPTGSAGASGEFVDCDPRKILCRIAPPQCGVMEVPSVDGTCYGECVKIDRCACASAAECPEQEQYTCWSQMHCGPYVK
jgi:hypothetical protein